MISHSARAMREVSETLVIYTFLYFWNKFGVQMQIPCKGHSKGGKSSVLQDETGILFVDGFAEKFLFSFQA